MRIFLKEAPEVDEALDEEVISTDTDSSDEVFSGIELPEDLAFIVSDELNELRDVIYNLDEDIHILLLNDDMVVLVKEDEDNRTLLYGLTPDNEEFDFIEMPLSMNEIVSNNNVIKYFPDQLNENHNKIVELFKHQIPDSGEDDLEDEEVPEEEVVEDKSDEVSEDIDDTSEDEVEEEDKDVKVNIKVK